MQKIIFLLLAWPIFSGAQRTEYEIAFLKNIPDSLTRPIQMPERDYNPNFRYEDTVSYRQKSRIFVIVSDSVYRKFFWRYTYTNDSLQKYNKNENGEWWYNWMVKHHVDSLPKVDFIINELVMYSACAQCMANCQHNEWNESCHRNACYFWEQWFIRGKKNTSDAKPVIRRNFMDFFTDNTDIDTLPGRNKKWVNLPVLFRYEITKFFEAVHKSSTKYVVGTDSLYYKIFSKYPKDSLPVFDFTKQDLVVRFSCYYCSSLGLLNGQPRHRNGCAYTAFWSVQDKKQINGEQDLQDGL